jgi:hypothetical protein
MAQIIAREKASVPYEVRKTDVLWLLRAVQAEGADQREVAAVLLNGFAWARTMNGYRDTLSDWVRAYAQPVSPQWYADGEKTKEALAAATTDAQRNKLLLKANARQYVHSTRTKFTEPTQRAVHAALTGQTKIPAQATDYAGPNVDASRKGYRPLQVQKAGEKKNRLWARPGTEQWEGYAIAGVLIPKRFPWLTVFFAAALAAVGAVYVWWPRAKEQAAA